MVHTVPVKQEKELVNLSRQQKFIHKKKSILEQNGGKATGRDCKQNLGLHWKKIPWKS